MKGFIFFRGDARLGEARLIFSEIGKNKIGGNTMNEHIAAIKKSVKILERPGVTNADVLKHVARIKTHARIIEMRATCNGLEEFIIKQEYFEEN